MYDARCFVNDIETTRNVILALGGRLVETYSFRDIVLTRKGDFNDSYVRIRIYDTGDRDGKKIVLTQKRIAWCGMFTKQDSNMVFEVFDTQEEAWNFARQRYGEAIKTDCEYFRVGWKYEVDGCFFYLERVQSLAMVEFEAEHIQQIGVCLARLSSHGPMLHRTMPSFMSRYFARLLGGRAFPDADHRVTRVLLRDARDLLLGRRTRGYGAGKWGLIGGKCNRFELPEFAIRREIREELRIFCHLEFYREVIDVEFDSASPWLVTIFAGASEPGQIYHPSIKEIGAIAFVNSASLDTFDFAFPQEKQIISEYFASRS